MENSEINNHVDEFDFCRICLFEPESDRKVKIINIFSATSGDHDLSQLMKELLDITVVEEDIKPKVICETCQILLIQWITMKRKAIETEMIIDRIIKKVGGKQVTKLEPVESTEDDLPLFFDIGGQCSSSSTKIHSNLPNDHQTTSGIQNNCYLIDNRNIKMETDDTNTPADDTISEDQIIYISDSDSVNEELFIDEKEPPATSVTDNTPVGDNNIKCDKETTIMDVMNKRITVRTSSLTLFTCLKPNCNNIYQSFKGFQNHYRKHFEIDEHLIICWQCFTDFPDKIIFTKHIQQGNCQQIGMFECYECDTKYNDLQSLSVHKIIVHKCTFSIRKAKKLTCPFCKKHCDLSKCKTHLLKCREKYGIKDNSEDNSKDNAPKIRSPKIFKFTPKLSTYICTYCKLFWPSPDSLENHFDNCEKYKLKQLTLAQAKANLAASKKRK